MEPFFQCIEKIISGDIAFGLEKLHVSALKEDIQLRGISLFVL